MSDPLAGLSQRMPPHVQAAEQALLGGLLYSNRTYDGVASFLRPEHFHDPINGRVYEAIARRIDAGQLADAVTLKGEFENAGVLDEVGGVAYLAQLLTAMVSPSVVAPYGRAIVDAWHRRQLIDIGATMINAAFAPDKDATARSIQEACESALFELAERGDTADAVSPAHETMHMAIEAAVAASNRPGGLIGITTGYRELDDITGGLKKGNLILLAGRPGMGKTTLALGMAAGAVQAGHRALFVTREMPRIAIGAKLTAGLAPVAGDASERGKTRDRDAYGRFEWRPIDQGQINRMVAAQRAMASRHLIIDECRAGTIAAIRSRARREKRRGGLDVIYIDYLGLLRVPELEHSDNETLRYSRLSMQAKALAVDLDVPVVLLAQLNRGVEGREDKRPGLSDLRQSGNLEQDADVVGFIFREHYYLTRSPVKRLPNETDEKLANRSTAWLDAETASRGIAEIILAKQRMGPTGVKRLAFHDENVWFGDLPDEGQ